MDEPIAVEGDLTIRPLRDDTSDYALLSRWRAMPHVHEWWDPDEPPPDVEQVRAEYGPESEKAAATMRCVLEVGGAPVGYVQAYRWADWISDPSDPDQMDVPLEEDPWGIDIFVGEPDRIDGGIGSRAVALLCRTLHASRGARTVMLTTELGNLRAQRAYEKAGFRKVRHALDTDTRDGERVWCWLMRWDPPTG
jgi:aminoglycoside 6'-N-acetyltransferase